MNNGTQLPPPKFTLNVWQSIILGTLLGISIASVIFILSKQPGGHPITLLDAPTPAPLLVHVDGQVFTPGVYELPRSARVQDAITAAGGLTAEADFSAINLAAKVTDGMKITIPAKGELPITPTNKSGPGIQTTTLLNINTATQTELESLPGIGPAKAAQIIAYRETNGEFLSIEDIKNVSGIGDATFNNIKDLITIE